MRKKYLVIAEHDFGRPITWSHSTDVKDCEAEADDEATEITANGENSYVYLFELKRVYKPTPNGNSRDVETIYVDPYQATE